MPASLEPKQIALLPIPANTEMNWDIEQAGSQVIEADRDLANAHRHIDSILKNSPTKSLGDLCVKADPRCIGIDLSKIVDIEASIQGVRQNTVEIISDDLFFNITVPDKDIREYIAYMLERQVDANPEKRVSAGDLLNMSIPDDLIPAISAINDYRSKDPKAAFEKALDALDAVVGKTLGLSDKETQFILDKMNNDPFLSQIRPMYEHRGLKEQPYSDHAGEDRYE